MGDLRGIVAIGLAVACVASTASPALAKDGSASVAKAAPGSVARDGKAGVAAWRRGDFAGALAIWRPLAEAGDAEAQFNIAQAYRLGRGVRQDEKIAMRWYERAARQGLTPAEANYGLLLLEDDRAAALPWLERAAVKGDPRAQYVIGTALFNGDSLPRDPVRAYAMMNRAAAAGLPQAVSSLAEMDRYLSPAQRQRGAAMADEWVKAPPPSPQRAVSASGAAAGPATATAVSVSPKPGASSGRWRIQLGAFGDGDRAEALWRRISAGNVALADKQPFLVRAGAVTRLQAGPFASRAAAEQACAAVRGAGQACFTAIAP